MVLSPLRPQGEREEPTRETAPTLSPKRAERENIPAVCRAKTKAWSLTRHVTPPLTGQSISPERADSRFAATMARAKSSDVLANRAGCMWALAESKLMFDLQ